MKDSDELKKILKDLIEKNHYKYIEHYFSKENNSTILNITIDSLNNTNISLNELSLISKIISDELDKFDKSNEQYLLNVQSKGIDDNIYLKDLNNYINENIYLYLNNPINHLNVIKAKLIEINDDNIIVNYFLKGAKKKLKIKLEEIKKGDIKIKNI